MSAAQLAWAAAGMSLAFIPSLGTASTSAKPLTPLRGGQSVREGPE